MDELIGALLMAVLVAFAVAAAIAIAVAIVACAAAVGVFLATWLGIVAFMRTLGGAVLARGGARRAPRDPEPAFELYVLGQLQRDVRLALEAGWAALEKFRTDCERYAGQWTEMPWQLLGWGIVIGAWTGMLSGAVGAGLLALPVLLLAGLFWLGSWMLVGVLRAAEWLRRTILRAHYECPDDHERFPLPVYVCPVCSAEHRQLVPGRWGIVRRECRCGEAALPTMVLNGRQRIPQKCPSGHPMAGLIGYAENLRVAIVAGARAGKTTYLGAAMMSLEQMAAGGRLAIDVLEQSRTSYRQTLDALGAGRLPQKTTLGTNPALVAEVQGEGRRSRVLYAYDVAGESYQGSDETRQLKFLEVPSALLLLIDPLAIPQVAIDHRERLAQDPDAVRASPQDPQRVLERTIAALGEAGVDTHKLPVALVVAKADAFGIGDEIAAEERAHPGRGAREWLDRHGAGNLVRLAEQEFKQVGWFACSALGRVPAPSDGRPFEPRGVAEPLLWLLAQRGLVPAAQAFTPAARQQRLAHAGTDAVRPIGPLGWAWRASLAGLTALFAVVLVGVVLASVAGSSSGSTGGVVDDGSSAGYDEAPASDPSQSELDVQDALLAWGEARHAREWCPLMTPGFRQRMYPGTSHGDTLARCMRDPGVGRLRTYELLDLTVATDEQTADADVIVTPGRDRRHYRFARVDGEWRVADNGNR